MSARTFGLRMLGLGVDGAKKPVNLTSVGAPGIRGGSVVLLLLSNELSSKLLVSPLISPIVVLYMIPYITPFKEFRLLMSNEFRQCKSPKPGPVHRLEP